MVIVKWVADLALGWFESRCDDPVPLLAKRFEERLAQIPPEQRTDAKLRELFLEVAETAAR